MESIIDAQAAAITPEKALLNGIPTAAEWSQGSINEAWLTQRADWIDSNYLRPPAFEQEGGERQSVSWSRQRCERHVACHDGRTDPPLLAAEKLVQRRSIQALSDPWADRCDARIRDGGVWSASPRLSS